jgi:hypothetical protein
MRRSLAVAACTVAVVCLGAGSALAGDRTANGDPTGAVDNANSICLFSGQNDFPDAPLDFPEGPGGRSQSYGQENRLGLRDPSTENPGKVGQGVFTFHPGFACNGNHGFFAGE